MKKRSKARILLRMIVLVKPLAPFMVLAVVLGTLGFLTAEFIPILGGYAVLSGLGVADISLKTKLNYIRVILRRCDMVKE